MKKLTFLFLLMVGFVATASAQHAADAPLYNPTDDAKAAIADAVKKASAEGKHVFLQVGGNWCGWCILFNKTVNENDELKTGMEKDFVVYHLNYSPENKNEAVLADLGFPQRFGFPVFVILDGNGELIHTQNSALLEEGKGYNTKRVMEFFKQWSPAALDPGNY